MKHKILLLLFLFSLLPSWGWGQTQKKETIKLDQLEGSYEINDPGEYTFTGKYKGTPDIDQNKDPKPVINVAAGLEVTIILDDATIDLSSSGGCPLSAKDASKVNLLLKGKNTLIAGDGYPGIWAPEKTNCGIIINELNSFKGSLEAIGDIYSGYGMPGIGGSYNNSDKKGYIIINGGNINAKGEGAAIGGASNSSGGIIIINGGNITATNETYGAGIGSGENGSESEITINGGTVTATSKAGAGIGSGKNSTGSNITITGGKVTVTSGEGAGIGGGQSSINNNITITGGKVTATSGAGAGIGNGQLSRSKCKITITGGTVTATSNSGAGIGNGYGISDSNIITVENGTAFINASGISDRRYKDNPNTKGLIFDGNYGAIYGDSYILSANATIESKKTLTIKENQTLVIKDGVTLTNEGTITNNGTILLIGDGKIKNNGAITKPAVKGYAVTYNLNYDIIPAEEIVYVENNRCPSEYIPNREYYKFAGWYDEKEEGNLVGSIENTITVYAYWEPIPFTIKSDIIPMTATYKHPFEYRFNDYITNISMSGGLESITSTNLPNDLFINSSSIIGTPTKIDESGTDINFTVTAKNGAKADIIVKYIVNKADLSLMTKGQITKVYDGNNIVTTPDVFTLGGICEDDDVHLDSYTLTYDNKNAGVEKGISLPVFNLVGDNSHCYSIVSSVGFALKGTITPAPLTITPKPNQKLFEGETPAYEVIGEVNNEKPEFNGSLGVESGKVVINSLALTTEFAQNYSLSLTPDIPITIINNETAKSLVQLNGTTNANGAYIDEVTVTAPEGFLIALESSSLKSSLVYTKSFTWNQKGTYDLNYKLKRISNGKESNDFSMEITVVESHYIPDNGGNDNNDSSITEYNIEIPEVEGISIDEGFGDHWIKDWKDFSFIITVKEGYVENSDPEVTIKGYDFEFDALTDTTYECKIDHVYKNAEVTITGIVKDPLATANNAIKAPEESWKIMNGVAYITVAKPTVFAVVDMNGNTISTNKLAPGVTSIYNLPRAKPIVFWFDKERAVKVIIK